MSAENCFNADMNKFKEYFSKYNIPEEPIERYNYSTLITALLEAYRDNIVDNISSIQIVNENMFSSQKLLMFGLVRDVTLSVEINDYYKLVRILT